MFFALLDGLAWLIVVGGGLMLAFVALVAVFTPPRRSPYAQSTTYHCRWCYMDIPNTERTRHVRSCIPEPERRPSDER